MPDIDHSGTIASGGTAQQLMGADDKRNGFCVQNLSSGDLWINFLSNNATSASAGHPSIKLTAGQLYERPPWMPCQYVISIYGATTGQEFTAWEWV